MAETKCGIVKKGAGSTMTGALLVAGIIRDGQGGARESLTGDEVGTVEGAHAIAANHLMETVLMIVAAG